MSNMMTQEEIERLLQNAGQVAEPAAGDAPQEGTDAPSPGGGETEASVVLADGSVSLRQEDYFTSEELDVLGEIGNICMGTAATTMYQLLGHKVTITTPNISMQTPATLSKEYPAPIVAVDVQYTDGILGTNLFLLKEYDVALITDLLMGGDGSGVAKDSIELDEIHLSAIREVMNQMVGSSATSLATILNKSVNISTPSSRKLTIDDDTLGQIIEGKTLVKISFKMEIEDVLVSEIMQIWPLQFAKDLVDQLLNPPPMETFLESAPPVPETPAQPAQPVPQPVMQPSEPAAQPVPQPAAQTLPQAPAAPVDMPQTPPAYGQQGMPQAPQTPPYGQGMPDGAGQMPSPYAAPNSQYPYTPYPPYGYAPYGMPPQPYAPQPMPAPQAPMEHSHAVRGGEDVQAKKVVFPSMDAGPVEIDQAQASNLGLLMEVPMQVTVVLGTAQKTVREVLDFNMGSIVVLDKLAGDLVEVMVNGVQIAKGEVVVVDDNYGVRITEINIANLKGTL